MSAKWDDWFTERHEQVQAVEAVIYDRLDAHLAVIRDRKVDELHASGSADRYGGALVAVEELATMPDVMSRTAESSGPELAPYVERFGEVGLTNLIERASALRGRRSSDFLDGLPEVRLDCARGHRVHWLQMNVDHNWRLTVGPSQRRAMPMIDGLPVIGSATPLDNGNDDPTAVRWRVRCPKCSYVGTPVAASLMQLFVAAAHAGVSSVRLQS